MEVFVHVLLGDNGYDGREVLGVYASHRAAYEAAVSYTGDFASEGFLVERRELGAAALEGFLEGFTQKLDLGTDLTYSMTGLAHEYS